MSLSANELYFFDQLKKNRKKKRYRKPPELLPFPLRLTGLSGAVRVEAYLKQQQQKSGIVDSTIDKENKQVNSEQQVDSREATEATTNQEALESINQSRKEAKFQEGESKKKFRRTLNLPDIGLTGFHTPPALRSLEQIEDDEDEDTQRFLFEENKFAAPNLLAQLGRLLEYIHDKHVEELEEINSVRSQISTPIFRSRPTSGKSTFSHLAELDEEILSESFLIEGYAPILIPLPEDLHNKLLQNYDQLCSSTVYVKREWQTTSYREQAVIRERLGIMSDSRVIMGGEPRKDINTDNKQQNASSKEITKIEGDKTPAKEKKKRSSIVPETDKKEENLGVANSHHGDLDNSPTQGSIEILKTRRESRTFLSSGLTKPRTRLEKYKFYPDKEIPGSFTKKKWLQGLHTKASFAHHHHGQQETLDDEEITTLKDFSVRDSKDDAPLSQIGFQGGHQATVINFSLLSKACEEKGWIVYTRQTDDLERQTLIEWARARLKHVINEKKEMEEKAKENGEDGPLIMRCYGDTKREAALKYKKGVAWAKRWNKPGEEDKRPKLLTQLPDGTAFCFYPSGRVAVCVTNPGTKIAGKYTFVYGDSPDRPMMASFTTTGCGCCYYPDGSIRFISTPKFGYIFEKDGNQNKKWKWPLGKLQVPVYFQLNSFVNFRCNSQSSMTLYFNCQNENAKFPVGATQGARSVKIQELGYLQTDTKFISLAAQQATKPKLTKRKDGRKRRTKKVLVETIVEEVVEQRQKELEEKFPERKEIDFDTPCQLELNKLQRKVKNIVFDWMEHYRIAVGITSPLRVTSKPRRRSQSRSAASDPDTFSSRQTGAGRGKGKIDRSPSAPPIPRNKDFNRLVNHSGLHSQNRPHTSTEMDDTGKWDNEGLRGLTVEVPTADQILRKQTGKIVSAGSGPHSPTTSQGRPPFRCGVIQPEVIPTSSARSGCPVYPSFNPEEERGPRMTKQQSMKPTHVYVLRLQAEKFSIASALRNDLAGEGDFQCRCDKRKIPLVTDLEYDEFIREHVPRTQLLVVSVTSSMYPGANPCDAMLNQLYYERNRNRTFPCVQARNDPFRLIRYDIAVASENGQPLLMKRHNAVPGMFLMYLGGRLQFADHIFNGYGNAKRDFLKQIMQTRKDALEGKSLPPDFRLTPVRGHSGMRSPWGGEIGGLKASYLVSPNSTPYTPTEVQPIARIFSADNTETTESTVIDLRGGACSAASFVNYGLSIDSPYPISPTSGQRLHPPGNNQRKIHTTA